MNFRSHEYEIIYKLLTCIFVYPWMSSTMKSEIKFILLIMTALPMIPFAIVIGSLDQVTEATKLEANSSGLDYNDFDQRIVKKFFDDEYNGDQYDGEKVFYSHSANIYGTYDEQVEKQRINNMFSDFGIVSPKFYQGNHEEMMDEMDKLYSDNDGNKIDENEFYKMIVSSCQMLVFSKWKGEIPSGVAIEVNHAIDIGIPVFELDGDEFIPQKDHVRAMYY
jgi:hypothetical protein